MNLLNFNWSNELHPGGGSPEKTPFSRVGSIRMDLVMAAAAAVEATKESGGLGARITAPSTIYGPSHMAPGYAQAAIAAAAPHVEDPRIMLQPNPGDPAANPDAVVFADAQLPTGPFLAGLEQAVNPGAITSQGQPDVQ